MKTVLERAKGSALDIVSFQSTPVGVMTPLPPHTKHIRSLYFSWQNWADIRGFSELDSGPLPLLRTLKIEHIEDISPGAMIPPSLLFSNAVDLREFKLSSRCSPFLNSFVFPNLTSFELSVERVEGFRASQLLDFLEASPILQTVHVEILADILFDDVPRERAVILPSVESLSLVVSDGGPGYDLVTRISCPSIKRTSLTHKKDVDDVTLYNIFPAPALWDAIVRQYKKSPVEEVVLDFKMDRLYTRILTSSLTFKSPDATVLTLYFEVSTKDYNWVNSEAHFNTSVDDVYCGAFSGACRIIRDLPLLTNVKHLEIRHNARVSEHTRVMPVANEVGRLFKSLGPLPLENLTLRCCDMRPYFAPSVVFPPIKELRISHPLCPPREGFEADIVGLAESQHALGIPFEYMRVDMEELPKEMEERLKPWVGSGYCYSEKYYEY